jgi:hypothetical protein
MNVFKSPKNEELYIECNKRKSNVCNFVSSYNIKNDTIIDNNIVYIDNLLCEDCKGRVYIRKSKKD